MQRLEVTINQDDSIEGRHVMKFKAGPGRCNVTVLIKTFRRSLQGIAEEQLRKSAGQLSGYRLREGAAEHEFLIEFFDRCGNVARSRRLWLEQRVVA